MHPARCGSMSARATGRTPRWRPPACPATPCRAWSKATRRPGTLRPELAARWRMARPPVLAGGAGDNAAGAVGLGAIRPGDAFVSLGTSGVLFAADRPLPPVSAGGGARVLPRAARRPGTRWA